MGMTTPEQLNAQYNNRALVPDFAGYLARWQTESAGVRAIAPCALDLRYASGIGALDDAGASLDVFKATTSTRQRAPVLLFIHGGYWRSLDKSDHSFIAQAFNREACVVVPNHALCPGTPQRPVTVAHIAHQIALAYAWVVRHIAQFGGDASRITVVGHSAGGHLAAMLMAVDMRKLGLKPSDAPTHTVAISGLFELETIRQTPYLNDSLHLDESTARQCSPAWMPAPARGSLSCFVGANESTEFRRHNQLMQTSWGKKRVPVAQEIAGANHFSVLDALIQTQSTIHKHVLACLG